MLSLWTRFLLVSRTKKCHTDSVAQNMDGPVWHRYVAVTTAVIAVLAAVASFQASSNSSLMLDEKNNSILFQNKANKEWNNYLADDITRHVQKISVISQEQKSFGEKATALENQGVSSAEKFQKYFDKNSNFVLAGTFLEIAIALSAMSTLVRQRFFWLFSLTIAGAGIYFLLLALI